MNEMSKDLEKLFYKANEQLKHIQDTIEWIRDEENYMDEERFMDEVYFNTKDCFELVVQFRALRDMILDELAQARYERDNGDMI